MVGSVLGQSLFSLLKNRNELMKHSLKEVLLSVNNGLF